MKYKNMLERDKHIYQLHRKGDISLTTLSEEFEITEKDIQKCIKRYHRLVVHRKEILSDIRIFLEKYASCEMVVTRIMNSLGRYMDNNNLFYIQEIKKLVYSDKIFIRGIGPIARALLKKYFEDNNL